MAVEVRLGRTGLLPSIAATCAAAKDVTHEAAAACLQRIILQEPVILAQYGEQSLPLSSPAPLARLLTTRACNLEEKVLWAFLVLDLFLERL